ncbi:MAG: hypothetical protein FD183_415 [Chitinophagaceae bacterium]|nr:MAG: hypothetical protein FD183_415 [Chitinophagaceae bacterium]
MPLYYQQNINDTTKLAVWKIEENDDFFLEKVSLHLPVTHPKIAAFGRQVFITLFIY